MPLLPKLAEESANVAVDAVKDKTSTVFGRAYLFSWVVYNYKSLIVIFSLEDFYTKLLWLPDFMPAGFLGLAKSLGIPFVCASLYVLASPSSEIIMRAGSRLSDYGLRRLNALLDRDEWYSKKEVEDIQKEFRDKLSSKDDTIRQQNGLIGDAKTINSQNLEKFRLLLDITVRLRSRGEFDGPQLGWDDEIHQKIIASVPVPLSSELASIRQLPEFCVHNFVRAVIDQANETRMPWISPPSSDEFLASIFRFVTLGLAETALDMHYQMTIVPTRAGVILIDSLAVTYAEKSFCAAWREYRSNKGW